MSSLNNPSNPTNESIPLIARSNTELNIDHGLNGPKPPTTINTTPELVSTGVGTDEHYSTTITPVNPTWDQKMKKRVDLNSFMTKQSLAHGVMDAALLSANVNQLRYVIQVRDKTSFYYFSLTLLCISIVIQVVLGFVLILTGKYQVTEYSGAKKADKANKYNVLVAFFLTFINVFITAFGLEYNDGLDETEDIE